MAERYYEQKAQIIASIVVQNYDCDSSTEMVGTIEMWASLIDIEKKFNMANGELNYIQKQINKGDVL